MLSIFLTVWFIAGVLQSRFTNLDGEEAYYAIFARHLAWGYFDHPPGIAFFVRLGMLLFPGDLGARFMMVVLSTATIWVGSLLLQSRHTPLYIATVSGLGLTQAGSFVIKTDVPLLFFTVSFFYLYKEYLAGRRRIALWALPVAIAGMLLSKYHGVLVIGLTVLSNPRLLRNTSFWFIALLSCVLVIPHAMWLYSNDFVTIRYQLGGRTDSGFSWRNVVGYLLMQPFVFGPAVGLLLLPASLIAPVRNPFDRALKFNLIGILGFFFIASFTVHIHMHWTSIALVPVLTLAIPFLWDRVRLRKILVSTALVTAAVFVPVRIYFAWDYLPKSLDRKVAVTHGWAQWAQDVRRLADGRNVIFLDDYTSAAEYTYYTGEMAHSFNAFWAQGSQHDLWPIENTFRGRPAIIVSRAHMNRSTSVLASNGARIQYRFVDDFQGYSKVWIRLAHNGPLRCKAAVPFDLPIVLVNRDAEPIYFKPRTELSPQLRYFFLNGQQIVSSGRCNVVGGITLRRELTRSIQVRPPATPGKYTLRFAIQAGWLSPPNNSRAYAVSVDPAR